MAFRADEAERQTFEAALSYLIPREISPEEKNKSYNAILDIVDKYGPAVASYPSWHPLVSSNSSIDPIVRPSPECGYKGLDHTKLFRNAFVTCPYDDGEEVIESINRLSFNKGARIVYEKLDAKLYHPDATPILVICEWYDQSLNLWDTIPLRLAAPLLLERELKDWDTAELAETWDTMKPYFLGQPHGARSSLFVDQETGQGLKKLWNAVIHTGMYGPIRV